MNVYTFGGNFEHHGLGIALLLLLLFRECVPQKFTYAAYWTIMVGSAIHIPPKMCAGNEISFDQNFLSRITTNNKDTISQAGYIPSKIPLDRKLAARAKKT
jgi:hypothetical protein